MKMEKVAGRYCAGFRPHDRTKTPGFWGLKVVVKLGWVKDHRVFLLCLGVANGIGGCAHGTRNMIMTLREKWDTTSKITGLSTKGPIGESNLKTRMRFMV